MINVRQFETAKDFIKECFTQASYDNPNLTIGRYAEKIGVGESSLKMIFSGKRKPTIHQVFCCARAHRLSMQECSYLETLVLKESAQNGWETSYYTKLLNSKRKEIKVSTVTLSKQALLTDPLALPLLVDLLDSKDTDIDYKYLASRFATTEVKIKDLVAYFQKNDMLTKTKDGKFNIVFDRISHRIKQKEYIKSLISDAHRKVETHFDDPASFFVNFVFSADKHSLVRLQLDLKKLMNKYLAEDFSKPGQTRKIAQANFQIYPTTTET